MIPQNLPKIEFMTSPSSGREVPNQVIIYADGARIFQSYGTNIVMEKNGQVYLDEKYWDYSATTGTYRNQFLGENKARTQENIKLGRYILTDLNPKKN